MPSWPVRSPAHEPGPEGAERVDHWVRLGTAHYRRLGADPVALRVVDRAGADDPDPVGQVAGAGLVHLSGANPGYLADTLRDSAVLAAILAAWEAGAALAGCSAGACALTALTEDMQVHETRPGPARRSSASTGTRRWWAGPAAGPSVARAASGSSAMAANAVRTPMAAGSTSAPPSPPAERSSPTSRASAARSPKGCYFARPEPPDATTGLLVDGGGASGGRPVR